MSAILFLAVIGLGIWIWNLSSRIEVLERKLDGNNKSIKIDFTTKNQTSKTVEKRLPWEPAGKTPSVAKKTTEPVRPKKEFRLEEFIGQKLFPILGATSIVLAVGFFTLWAFANGWVGPMGRIALGVMFSLVLIVLGEFIRKKYPHFFQYFTAAGVAGLIITTFMARYHYEFLSSLESLILYTVEAAAGVMLSLRYNSRILGNFSILGALIAPFLIDASDPNIFGLLGFVCIITLAGFILASQKKWPEIYTFLLIFSTIFELMSIDEFKSNPSVISPIILLGFIFLLHTLIGAGGLMRLWKENIAQSHLKPKEQDIYEVILFSLSLLVANLLAFNIFNHLDWNHFGFVVGFEALVLYGLAEWFRGKRWQLFHMVTLSSSLVFLLFATIWELQSEDIIILTLTLIGEGALLCFAGQASQQKVFDIFGKIALSIAFLLIFEIEDATLSLLSILSLIAALVFSVGKPKTELEKVWLGVSLLFSSIMIFFWSIEQSSLPTTLTPAPVVIWSLVLLAAGIIKQNTIVRVASTIVFVLMAVISMEEMRYGEYIINASLFAWIFLNGAAIYYTQKTDQRDTLLDQFINYGALIILTLGCFFFAGETYTEPYLTITWLVWASLLLTVGVVQKWVDIRYVALGIFLLIIAKLYFVDVWQWEVWGRFLAFFALGVSLLGVGFFYQKIWTKK